jgi:hypothetical protein
MVHENCNPLIREIHLNIMYKLSAYHNRNKRNLHYEGEAVNNV